MVGRTIFGAAWTLVFACIVLAGRAIAQEKAGIEKPEKPVKAVVAVFTLQGPLTETPMGEQMPLFSAPGTSLKELVWRLRQAGDDRDVKAVVLLSDGPMLGGGQIEELRQALAYVRSKDKDVLVHSDSMGLGEYALYSAASRISVTPTGDLWVMGLQVEQPYIRGLLDKINVLPDFLTCGEYKSAAEIFTRTSPSPEADRMTNWLLDSMYESILNQIAKGRQTDRAKAKEWLDHGPYSAEKAKGLGMIDAVEQRQTFEAGLRAKLGEGITFDKRYGQKKQPQMDFSSPMAMFRIWGELLGAGAPKRASNKPSVAIVYVEGPIMLGSGEEPPSPLMMGDAIAASGTVRRALDKAAADDSIKAVVLRVNSPGGSATASEIILDATRRVKAKKPLVVSMGNVAGSGGYYVACAADTIFADETTITGSIGVVGGKMVTSEMWAGIGIHWKEYTRGQNAGIMSSNHIFTREEKDRMQGWMNDIYGVFKRHVTDIRGDRLKKPIDELAGGRVYTGRQALDLGLVDRIGTLYDAVAYAAEQAKMKEYDVRVVPEPRNFIEMLMAGAGGMDEDDAKRLDTAPRARWTPRQPSVVDLALPHLQGLDPQKVAPIKQALLRLELLRREGVVLMMPELTAPW